MNSNRAVLEVLKWCSASDLLLNLSQVCLFYSSLSNQPEVWFELLGADYSSHSDLSPKQQYRFVATQYIPVVSSDSLRKFYVHTQSWQSLPLSETVRVHRFMCTALTRLGQVFVTGTPSTPDTFQIHSISGLVTFLDSLITHRNSMGVIRYQDDIYALAGYSGSGYHNECEVYMYKTAKWRKLPNCLNARSAATPAAHNAKIYLLGGCGTITAEYLHTTTETFHLLPMELPDCYCTIALCTDTELRAVQELGFYSCNIENPPNYWEITRFPFDFGIAFWSDCPVFCSNGDYYIHQNYRSRVIVLNLQKMTFTEFPTNVQPLES